MMQNNNLTKSEYCLGGYISVFSALTANSRTVYSVRLDNARYAKVMRGNYHRQEKRQYAILKRICEQKGVPILFENFTTDENPYGAECGGIAAVVGDRLYTSERQMLSVSNPYFAVLDGIEDPYNFGQVLRSLYASGVDGVIVPRRNFFSAAAIVARASAGASELMRVCAVDDIAAFCDELIKIGVTIYATAADKSAKDVYAVEYKRPLCVIFGGERRGISKAVTEKCNSTLCIPYPRDVGVSLSATSAAAIVAFEIGRRLG